MGRSAKFAKRPTKAEKLSRQVNAPPKSSSLTRERSLSPDLEPTRSAIPLFNTSRKGSRIQKGSTTLATNRADHGDDEMEDHLAGEDDDTSDPLTNAIASTSDSAANWINQFPLTSKRKTSSTASPSSSEKLRKAKESMALDQRNHERKLGRTPAKKGGVDKFKLGVDYVTLHEKRNGGERFKKKLR